MTSRVLNGFDIDLTGIFFIPKVREALKLLKAHGRIESIGFVIGIPSALADGLNL